MYGDTITPSKVILHDDFLGLEYSKPALLQDVMAGELTCHSQHAVLSGGLQAKVLIC